MKNKILLVIGVMLMSMVGFTGCSTESDRVSYNISQQANNFNVVRQLTVINCIQGDVLYQMTGRMSITANFVENQLEVLVEDDNGGYQKHIIGLSDNVTYVVEQVKVKNVSQYSYTLNFNPRMWIPITVENMD